VELFVYSTSLTSPSAPPSHVWPLPAYLSASHLTAHERKTVGTAVEFLQNLLGDVELHAAGPVPATETLCYLAADGTPWSLTQSITATLGQVPAPKAPTKPQLHEFEALAKLIESQLVTTAPVLKPQTLPQLAKTLYRERDVARAPAATLGLLQDVDRDVVRIADHFTGNVDTKTFAAALALRMMVDQSYETLLAGLRAQRIGDGGGDAL
jgi:hypothetical protein